jgi:hypothetical protein
MITMSESIMSGRGPAALRLVAGTAVDPAAPPIKRTIKRKDLSAPAQAIIRAAWEEIPKEHHQSVLQMLRAIADANLLDRRGHVGQAAGDPTRKHDAENF